LERDEKMKRIAAFGVALAAICPVICHADPPQLQIHNKQLRLKLYVPDTKEGFYRGTRFDWSGVIADLEFAGHHLYRPWFTAVDPAVRDFIYKDESIVVGPNSAMTGPVEEFQTPIGYENAKQGERFLKVGVGFLRKEDDAPYSFSKHFELIDGGKWTTRATDKSVTFEQVLGESGSDYGYVYTKTVRLVDDTSQVVIEHRLRNTGKLAIATRLYDHNFLTIDGLSVGSGYSISVPYTIQSTRAPDSKFVTIDGSTAKYIADLHGQDRVVFGLQGSSGDPKDYYFDIENRASNMKIIVTGDHPLANASVWSIRSVLAVEPFIDLQAEPGEAVSWKYTYTYSRLDGHSLTTR
jgi:hypothetical protein